MISIFLMISLFGVLSEKSIYKIIMAELEKKFVYKDLSEHETIQVAIVINKEEVLWSTLP